MTTPYRLREEPGQAIASASSSEPRPLGRMRSSHAGGGTTRRVLGAMTGIAGVLAVLSVAWPHAPWMVAVALAFALVVGGWVVLANVLGLDLVADVHEGGIVIRRSWRRPVVIAFDAVTALHVARGLTDTSFVFELESRAAGRPKQVTLPLSVSEPTRFLAAVETNIEGPVLEDAKRALASGEPLTFGSLVLELDGVRHRDDLLAWSDVDHVRVSDAGLVFIQKSTQYAFVVVATRDVAFPRVLVALLARRTRIEADDPFWTRFV